MSDLPFMTVPDAAEAIGVSESTVRRWCRDGELAAEGLGSMLAVHRTGVTRMQRRYIRATEAADLLGVSDSRLYKLVAEKKLVAERFGSVLMVHRSSLEAYQRERAQSRPRPRRQQVARYNGRHTVVPVVNEERRARLRELIRKANTAVVLDAHGNKIGEIERE